jgi:hypothetical protein
MVSEGRRRHLGRDVRTFCKSVHIRCAKHERGVNFAGMLAVDIGERERDTHAHTCRRSDTRACTPKKEGTDSHRPTNTRHTHTHTSSMKKAGSGAV